MKKNFTFLQLFFILDGRLSTSIDDVYNILNHICDYSCMTHHLPVAMEYLKMKNPKWLKEQMDVLNRIYEICPIKEQTREQFLWLVNYIIKNYDFIVEVPQLKDEFDTSDFATYMIENSLLLKKE